MQGCRRFGFQECHALLLVTSRGFFQRPLSISRNLRDSLSWLPSSNDPTLASSLRFLRSDRLSTFCEIGPDLPASWPNKAGNIRLFRPRFRTGFRLRREQVCRTAREEASSHGTRQG